MPEPIDAVGITGVTTGPAGSIMAVGFGVYLRRNGTWSSLDCPATHQLQSGLAAADGTIWASGDDGAILRLDP